MKVAVIGSRGLCVEDLSPFLCEGDEIVSGGARGIDACAAAYARHHGHTLTVFPPDYKSYGRAAPLVRNRQIVDYADRVIAFWDGSSRGTRAVIEYARVTGTPCEVVWLSTMPDSS